MTGTLHRGLYRPDLFPAIVIAALLLTGLTACATDPPNYEQEARSTLEECDTELQRDATRWCLGVMGGKGFVLVRQVAGGEPQISDTLPMPMTTSLKMIETLAHGFDSLWVSYSGHPMGVLRIDPETLRVQAQIPVDTGWSSRRFGSLGLIAVGSGAVWAASEGVLHRIDPLSNTITSSARIVGSTIAAGQGAVWIAAQDRVIKIDPETLRELQSFALPAGMNVPGAVYWADLVDYIDKTRSWKPPVTGILTVDETSVFVLLSVRGEGFWSCGLHCMPSLVGTLDPTTSTIVVDPNLRFRQ